MSLEEAVLEAGAVGIILDPIFQGLAVALMTGVFASTLLTLVLIPLLFYVVMKRLQPQTANAAPAETTSEEE